MSVTKTWRLRWLPCAAQPWVASKRQERGMDREEGGMVGMGVHWQIGCRHTGPGVLKHQTHRLELSELQIDPPRQLY